MVTYLSLIGEERQKSRFKEIYMENRGLMAVQARRILDDYSLAEDAVHDAFVRIAENMDTVERLNRQQVKRYALVAAKNAAIDLYRKRRRQTANEVSYEELEPWGEEDRQLEGTEGIVWEMLMGLPELYKDVFLLKYSVGLSNEEIGRAMKLTVSGVKQRIARGKELLKEKLAEEKMEGR